MEVLEAVMGYKMIALSRKWGLLPPQHMGDCFGKSTNATLNMLRSYSMAKQKCNYFNTLHWIDKSY